MIVTHKNSAFMTKHHHCFCSNASNDLCLHFPNKWPFVSWVTHLCHKQQWKDGRFDNVTTLRREVVLNTKWQTLTCIVYSKQSACFCFFLLILASFLASKHTHSLTLTLFNSYTLNQMADLKTLLSCIQSQKTVTAVSYFILFSFLGFHKMCSLCSDIIETSQL